MMSITGGVVSLTGLVAPKPDSGVMDILVAGGELIFSVKYNMTN